MWVGKKIRIAIHSLNLQSGSNYGSTTNLSAQQGWAFVVPVSKESSGSAAVGQRPPRLGLAVASVASGRTSVFTSSLAAY